MAQAEGTPKRVPLNFIPENSNKKTEGPYLSTLGLFYCLKVNIKFFFFVEIMRKKINLYVEFLQLSQTVLDS